MTDPSNPDLVEQLAEKYSCYHTGVPCECAPIDYKAAIREAISVTRRETLEQIATVADERGAAMMEEEVEYQEGYTTSDLQCAKSNALFRLAAEIRRLGENK